jgi:hypothetical protein
MCDTFTIEVDDSEILLGNGRVDLSVDKWCHTVCELRRAQAEIERLRERIKEWDRTLRASVPEDLRGATSPVGCVQNYIVRLEQRIGELEALHCETVEEINVQDGIFITTDQIDAAWGFVSEESACGIADDESFSLAVFAKVGIVRCGRCGSGPAIAVDHCLHCGKFEQVFSALEANDELVQEKAKD